MYFMRNSICRFLFVIACVGMVGYISPAFAEDAAAPAAAAKPLNIAVVDVEKILIESKAAKSIKAQVEKNSADFIADVKKAENTLREKQKALQKEAAGLSKEDLNKKAKTFEEGRLAEKKRIEGKKAKLDKAYAEAMGKLTNTIYKVCQSIADARKIDLIITRQNIIVGAKSLDITGDVLANMDKELPSLTLDLKK